MSMRVNVTLNDELETKLKDIATERNVGLAQVLRDLINEYELHAKETNHETKDPITKPNHKHSN